MTQLSGNTKARKHNVQAIQLTTLSAQRNLSEDNLNRKSNASNKDTKIVCSNKFNGKQFGILGNQYQPTVNKHCLRIT